MEDRYEITLDPEEDQEMSDSKPEEVPPSNINNQLKSTVVKRKGRGFSTTSINPSVDSHFETLNEEVTGRAIRSIEGWIIFIRGLHEECTEDDVVDQCMEYGKVRDVKINLDHRTGYLKGYALVEYADYGEARRAVDSLNGFTFMDCPIEADFAFIKSH